MYLRYLQTPRLLISAIHVKLNMFEKVFHWGYIYRNNVDIKKKLIRYDPNDVPYFFFLNSATCIFSVLYAVYVLDLHWQQSFAYITNVYFKQWPGEFRVIFGIRKCAYISETIKIMFIHTLIRSIAILSFLRSEVVFRR